MALPPTATHAPLGRRSNAPDAANSTGGPFPVGAGQGSALDCFRKSGCAPPYECVNLQEMPPGGQPVCMDFLRGPDPHRAAGPVDEGSCVAYSFSTAVPAGAWELRLVQETPCEVHLFNPALTLDALRESVRAMARDADADLSRLHLHDYGIPGMARGSGFRDRELPLGEIKRKLGHHRRILQVLRVDCEGCEFAVIERNAMNKPFRMLRQLIVRIDTRLSRSRDAVDAALQALRVLIDRQGFRAYNTEPRRGAAEAEGGAGLPLQYIVPRW